MLGAKVHIAVTLGHSYLWFVGRIWINAQRFEHTITELRFGILLL